MKTGKKSSMLLKTSLVASLAVFPLVYADEFVLHSTVASGKGAAEYWTCDTGIGTLTFDYVPLGLGDYPVYDAICGYPPAIGSILLCIDKIRNDKSDAFMERAFKYASASCHLYSSYLLPPSFYKAQYENATKYYVPFEDVKNLSEPIYFPTTPNITALLPEYIGYTNYYFNLDSGTWFSVGICGFFLLLIVLSAIHNFARRTFAKSVNSSHWWKTIQGSVLFPTILTKGKFAQPYEWKYLSALFPNRLQFIVDVFFFALQMAFYCVSYKQNEGWWFGSAKQAWQRFLGDRTGIMAFGKIPLLILFAGRNNFLLAITGWSQATFLHFHKVTALWMALDALIHSVAYTCYDHSDYASSVKQLYFACGIAATTICFVMIGASVYPLRKAYYEYFLFFHVLFAIAFIIMCWYHCNTLGWMEWMIAACSVWFFERLIRFIRCTAFGYRTATITAVADELMKIEVSKPSWWFHNPGTHCYVYFANWLFWENHPFTCVVEGDKLCAYIKVKKGVTYRVWNKLNKNGGKMNWKICIEGPYGGELAPCVKKYDDAILLAGGSGVPGILEHAANVTAGKLIWVTPTLSLVRAYYNLIQKVNIDIEIYVTRENNSNKVCSLQELCSASESSSEDEKKSIEAGAGQITINYGKPNINEILEKNVESSCSNNMAIVACGPPRMMDELRHVVSERVTSWKKSIDFFDELQVW